MRIGNRRRSVGRLFAACYNSVAHAVDHRVPENSPRLNLAFGRAQLAVSFRIIVFVLFIATYKLAFRRRRTELGTLFVCVLFGFSFVAVVCGFLVPCAVLALSTPNFVVVMQKAFCK
jgi:hypothetical protein